VLWQMLLKIGCKAALLKLAKSEFKDTKKVNVPTGNQICWFLMELKKHQLADVVIFGHSSRSLDHNILNIALMQAKHVFRKAVATDFQGKEGI